MQRRRYDRSYDTLQPGRVTLNPFSQQYTGLVAAWLLADRPNNNVIWDVARGQNEMQGEGVVAVAAGHDGGPGACYVQNAFRNSSAYNLTLYGFPALNTPFSITVWHASVTATGNQTIWSYGNNVSNKGITLNHNTSGNCGAYNVSNGGTVVQATDPSAQMAWVHYAYTWDGTTSRLYFNGVQRASTSTAPEFDTANVFRLMKNTHPSFTEYAGPGARFNDLRLYNVAVPAGVIWKMFDRPTRLELFMPAGKRRRSYFGAFPIEEVPPGRVVMAVP